VLAYVVHALHARWMCVLQWDCHVLLLTQHSALTAS
jgi:hypothetical protein